MTWEVLPPEQAGSQAVIHSPGRYYPGDKYADWIGLSAFSRDKIMAGEMYFRNMMGRTYEEMRASHPDKPIMQAEFGKTRGWEQPRWMLDAYRSMKEMPGLKAAIYYDNVTLHLGDDKTLSEESLQIMKEIFRDP
jgi:beta-mannanase